MWPYFQQPRVEIGPFTIYAFAALLVAGVLTARWIILRRAVRLGIDRWIPSRLITVMLVAGFAGAMVERGIVSDIPRFLNHPLMSFDRIRGIASLGGLGAGLAGGWLWCRTQHLRAAEAMQLLDLVCYALPFGFAFGRLGCTLAHDHRGFASTGWFSFDFPEGPRYDLGLIELVFLVALCAVFVYLGREPKPAGFFFGLYGVVYGGFRLWLDTLHTIPLRFVGAGIVVLVGIGGWVWMWRRAADGVGDEGTGDQAEKLGAAVSS